MPSNAKWSQSIHAGAGNALVCMCVVCLLVVMFGVVVGEGKLSTVKVI